MNGPSIGIFIATAGNRESLNHTLHSIATQKLQENDDVLVVGDGPALYAQELVAKYGPPFRFLRGPDKSMFGHPQHNFALTQLTADWFVGQDDDDIFTPRAIEEIRAAIVAQPDATHAFRFETGQHVGTLPDLTWWNNGDPNWANRTSWDGHCPVWRHDLEGVSFDESQHGGDQDYVRLIREATTTKGWPLIAHNQIIGVGRPKWNLWEWPVTTPEMAEELRKIYNVCLPNFTHVARREDGTPIEISEKAQARWFEALTDHDWPYLVTLGPNKPYVGFFYLRNTDAGRTVSVGMLPEYLGEGRGKELLTRCIYAAQGPLVGDIAANNVAVRVINRAIGWVEGQEADGIVSMAHPYI